MEVYSIHWHGGGSVNEIRSLVLRRERSVNLGSDFRYVKYGTLGVWFWSDKTGGVVDKRFLGLGNCADWSS